MKKISSLLLALTMVVCSFSFTFASDTDVIEIATADELKALAQTIADDENAGEGKTYKLVADIDLGNAEWSTYIGTYEKPFLGTFDGNGHIIKNYTITIPNSGSTPDFQLGIGLFGCISGDAVIKNLGVENITVGSAINSWRETAGGIVGIVAGSATVSGCYAKNLTVTDTVSPDIMSVAGIAASIVSDDAVIENCYATGMDFQLGVDCDAGIVGATIAASSIRNCYSTKTITRVHNTAAEGTGAKVTNCYYVETAPWPAEMYFGTQVTADALKGMAATLGDAFKEDYEGDFQSNSGYPILVWEENTKLLDGDALIESSEDGAIDIDTLYPTITVVFDKMLASSTIDEYSVLVDKDVEYSVIAEGEYTDTVVIEFGELELKTTYTITFTDDIMTYAGYTVVDGQTVAFKTGVGFANMVENGDMESNNASMYYLKAGTASFDNTIANSQVISFVAQWNDQPIVLNGANLKPGTYYMGAWLMAKEDMTASLTMSDEDKNWPSKTVELTANEWVYVDHVFEPGFNVTEVSIRNKVKNKTLYIDNWCLYDLSKAPDTETVLVNSSIEDGAENISPFGFTFDLEFSGEVRPSSLINGVTISDDYELTVDYSASDISKVKFSVVGDLELGRDYTISFAGLTDIAGNAVDVDPITFSTFAEPDADTVVESTTPDNNATGVNRSFEKILINFDAPIDETTIDGITVTPAIAKEVKLSSGSQVIVVIDSSKVKFDTEYTVNVPRTVKTIPTNSGVVFNAVPYEFSFTTITEEDVAAVINAAIGDATAMEAAINGIYDELPVASKAYEFVLEELADNTEELYTTLAAIEEIEDVEDLQYALNSISVGIILNNVDDKEVVAELFTDCAGLFTEGLQTAYNDYISEDTQEAIAEKAIDMKDESYDEVKEMIVFETIKASFAETSGSTAVENLIKAVADCLTGTNSIDSLIEDADESSKSAKIYGELQGLEIIELSDIKSSLKAAIKKYEGGGGGGGGTGGTGTTKAPGQGSAGFIPVMPETTVTASVFNDLASVTWAKDSIEALYNKGIINGKADGVFDPDGLITRAEFAKIAVLAVGGYDANATADFADVSASDWSYSYVASAYNLGLINGIGDGLFGGNNYITREEMATILSRMAKTAGLELTKDVLFFTDEAEIADYAKEAVTLLSSNGIVNGTGNGKFEPKGNATRAQAAVIFDRFLAKSGN